MEVVADTMGALSLLFVRIVIVAELIVPVSILLVGDGNALEKKLPPRVIRICTQRRKALNSNSPKVISVAGPRRLPRRKLEP